MSVLRHLIPALLLGLATGVAAQSATDHPLLPPDMRRPPRPPEVWIPPQPQATKPVVLDEVKIDIRMHGFLARTRIEMSFDNPNTRVLEGEFVFPLGAGQTVTGYALEVNGAMREGVVVPKQTARVAFEDITRVQIDPGLAELTAGNVFRTRLYPIPARGKKRIALEFEQVMDDAGTHWRYLLPLQFRDPVRRFSVQAEAPLDAKAPELGADSPDPDLTFEAAASVWRAAFTRENVTPQRELAFRVPKQAGDAAVLEARDTLEPAQRAVLARIDTGLPENLPPPPKPRRIALFFDASGSAHDRDLAREREALAAWIVGLDQAVQIDLIAFRERAQAAQRIALEAGKADALLKALQELALDGASNYASIDFAAAQQADIALIIGDGLDTWGTGQIDWTHAPTRLYALHAAQRADHARLERIAQRGGGSVIDLTRIDAGQARAALDAARWRLLDTRVQGQCSEIVPQAPQAVGASLTLAARCNGKASLMLSFGSADGQTRIERELRIGEHTPLDGALAESLWRNFAALRIARMQSEAQPDTDAITRLATRYGVVTAHTSLLVLDRIEDYVRYGVEPKEAPLREQYRKLTANRPKSEPVPDRRSALQALSQRWAEFRTWHQERHPWLETLLLPSARSEAELWKPLPGTKDFDQGRREVEHLVQQAQALSQRWAAEGADAERRKVWENQATALMLKLDALRERRIELAPNSPRWQSQVDTPAAVESGVARSRSSTTAHAAFESASPMAAADAAMESGSPPPSPPSPPAPVAAMSDARPALENDAAASTASPARADIQLSGWNPDTPYLKALRQSDAPYQTYLKLRAEHLRSPSFFLDVADFLRTEAKEPELALRVLSNLAEIGDENTALLRVLGHRLMQWDRPELALRPFEDALIQRPEEPQSHRDLALALTRLEQPQIARAVELLWTVATGSWSPRLPDIDLIALHELNALLAMHPDTEIGALDIPPELLQPLPINLRVLLSWDADNTDIDLWIIDPTGEAIHYAQPRSTSGGHISRDFTQGYGPEVFTIARPLPGTYRVQAHYFGDRRQSLTGPVTVQVEFQTGFGQRSSQRQATTRRLETGKQRIDIGHFRVGP